MDSEREVRKYSQVAIDLAYVLYGTLLIAAGISVSVDELATLGGALFGGAIATCAAWAWVFTCRSRPRGLLQVLLCAPLVYFLLITFLQPPHSSERLKCSTKLHDIAAALQQYHDTFKSFPPAYIADKSGRPKHSWRVLILPFLQQQPLYDSYRFDEPWDGPNNRKLINSTPQVYYCPYRPENDAVPRVNTDYFAIVGESTAWTGERPTVYRDILDGTSNTIQLCEVTGRRVPWTKPEDLTYDEALELITSQDPQQHTGHLGRSFLYKWSNQRHIATCDAQVISIGQGADSEQVARMLSRSDGHPVDFDILYGSQIGTRQLRIANRNRMSIFVLLALWPLPWVWINPHGNAFQRATAESSADKSAMSDKNNSVTLSD